MKRHAEDKGLFAGIVNHKEKKFYNDDNNVTKLFFACKESK